MRRRRRRQDATPTISVDGDGPFAPGAAVNVAVTGAVGEQFGQVDQCSADGGACTFGAFVELDAAGSASVVIHVRRYLAGDGGVVDCASSPCRLTFDAFDGRTVSTPIAVDGRIPIVRPTITVVPATSIRDRSTITVTGRGFESDAFVNIDECAWTDAIRCLGGIGFAQTDANGTFTTRVPVARVVKGQDCATRPNLCQLWVEPQGNIDQIVATGLGFDPTSTAQVPHVSVEPATALRDEQNVAVHGAGFIPDADASVEECVTSAPNRGGCRFLTNAATGHDGALETEVAVRRRVGIDDCAVDACVLRVTVFPFDQVDVVLAFDTSIPPPPAPSVTVEPATGLVDRQVVDVQLHDVEPGSFVELQLCAVGESACHVEVSQSVDGPAATIPMSLPHVGRDGVDCAVTPCELRVGLFGADSYSFAVPVAFDPDAPLAGSGSLRVVPANGLWDRQQVEVRGDRLDPGTPLSMRECTTPEAAAGSCTPAIDATVDSRGELSAPFSVRRSVPSAAGVGDCAQIACYLVVDGEPGAALPLTFDPNGPARGSDLPAQLACVAWPTDGWPVGPLPKGVDAARVAAVGEQAVGPGGGDSIVVIYGGKLVYENYADGVSADSVLPSFSMSKSFTSTMVGLLVDEGKLALDARAPIDAWAAPDDPRNAITLRNLLNMASGLQWYESYTEAASDVIKMVVSPDNAAYAIAKPLEVTPGTRFQYSTGDTMVLAKIIGDTAGVSGDAYAQYLRDRLLDPLGIVPAVPGIDPAGTWRGGYQTDTTTRNFAKLGLLYLRDGVWEDRQFLSPDWVDFVRTPGPSPGYGGQFWLNGDGSFSMIGLYGQSVQIVPQLDLIVAGNNGGGTGQMVDLFRNAEKPSCGGTTAPAAADDAASVTALKAVDVNVLANDSGGTAGLAAATLTVADPPAHGTADVVDGRIRYRSEAGFTGTDSLRYAVCTTDRRDCVEANVAVEVRPLAFEFRPPIEAGINTRTPGQRDLRSVPYARPDSRRSRASRRSRSTPRAARSSPPANPVDADLHARVNRGAVWFWWSTNAAWTGCRDLQITLADGETHAAHFAWRARRQ